MLSQDLKPDSGRRAANAIPEDRILNAATKLMSTIGIRRTTMADVARASGVSRATLYRRFPNIQALAAQVTTREFVEMLAAVPQDTSAPARERTIVTIVHLVRSVRDHPLLQRIIELDPEFLMPYLLHRTGRTAAGQLEMIEGAIATGQFDGSIRSGGPRRLATTALQMAWSFALTGPVFTGPGHDEELDAELSDVLERYLRP